MKKIAVISGLSLMLSPIMALATPCDESEVALSEDLLKNTRALWNRGFGTKTDVLLIEDAVLDLKFCANQISKINYCAQKENGLTELLRLAKITLEHETTPAPDSLGTAYRISELLRELVALRRECAIATNPN